jgi:hypothetical protein
LLINFIICTPHHVLIGYEFKSYGIGEEYGTYGKTELETGFLVGKPDGNISLGRAVEGRRYMNRLLSSNLHGSKQEKEVDACDHGHELLGSLECSLETESFPRRNLLHSIFHSGT